MRFVLPDQLLVDLRAMQSARGNADDIVEKYDAFVLDPGLGPVCYLTADGRVLLDESGWDEAVEPSVREATEDEAISVLVVGARKTGVSGLLDLLPPRPSSAVNCFRCNGERYMTLGKNIATGEPGRIICPTCSGRGWVDPSISPFEYNVNMTDSAPHPKLLTVIEPTQRWGVLDWQELWRARELLFFFTWRDVKIRYKQTFLGVAWAVLQPALLMIVFSLFFGRLHQPQPGDLPIPLFICAGILPWTFFATGLGNAANSVVGSERMISKIYFPRLLLPLSSVGAALVDFAIAVGLLGVMMLWYQVPPAITIILVPIIVLIIALTAAGLGILLAALNVNYRDFRYIIPFLIQVGLFMTPNIYLAADLISPRMERWLLLNPMHALVGGFRAALFGLPIPWIGLMVALLISLVVFMLGVLYFRRVEGTFADNI